MELFATIISGTIVYVTGRIIEKVFVDPIQEMRRTITDIQVDLVFYANVYTATMNLPDERRREASTAFRTKASRLLGLAEMIPRYDLLARVGTLPDRARLQHAAGALIAVGNIALIPDEHGLGSKAAAAARAALQLRSLDE